MRIFPTKFLALSVAPIIFVSASFAQSLPDGGTIIDGDVTISTPNTNSLLIDQTSTNGIIEWNGFSVGDGKTVHFDNGTGATLNRVTGSDISQIDGSLTATGSLFLINSNGVIIGQNGIVQTGGSFVASTLDITNDDFLNGGDNSFTGNSNASVLNLGQVSSLGGDVVFLAHTIVNEGLITAPNGTVGLAAGREILLRDAALDDGKIFVKVGDATSKVEEKGIIEAASVELRANGGNVYALAGNTGGSINATGVAEKDGRIFLTAGDEGRVITSKTIVAKRKTVRQTISKQTKPKIDGGDVFINAGFVSLGGMVDLDGDRGGSLTIDAGLLSLAEEVSARGLSEEGGNVAINTTGDSLVYSTASIDVSGATNGGTIRHITGRTLTHSGTYEAIGRTGKGGQIDIGGGATRLLSPTIDASGKTAGGLVRIGGELRGGLGLDVDDLPNTLRLAVTDGTNIRADATGENGDGGTVILWADELATVLGHISARPGTRSGQGGFIEISSGENLSVRTSAINTAAADGSRGGTILLDPKNITIDDVAAVNQSVFVLGFGYTYLDVNQLAVNDGFGSSISLDGNRLVVGAAGDDGFANNFSGAGAAYLFSFTDADFSGAVLEGIIGNGYTGGKNYDISTSTTSFDFGTSVSLDGNRLAVGQKRDDGFDDTGNDIGAVYLFSFTDDNFSGVNLEATIGSGYTGGKNINLTELEDDDNFGISVSLDGDRLAVGAGFDGGATNSEFGGAVYLFSFDDASFTGGNLEATIGAGYTGGKNYDVASLDQFDRFGISVSLDGDRLAVAAASDDGADNSNNNSGAHYLFSFTDSDFSGTHLEAIIGTGYTGGKNIDITEIDGINRLGQALSLDGNQLALGSYTEFNAEATQANIGAVHLFSFTDSTFSGGTHEATIGKGYTGEKNIDVPQLGNLDFFATSVSLDGGRLAVGVPADDGSGNARNGSGAAYLFTNPFGNGTANVSNAGFASGPADDVTIDIDSLKALLDAGNDVVLQANNDISFNTAFTIDNTGGDGGDLTAQAGRSILINADITTDNGDITFIANELSANGVVDANRDAGDATITIANGVDIDAGLGDISFDLRWGAGKTNTGASDIVLAGNNTLTGASIALLNQGAENDNDVSIGAGSVINASGAGDAIQIVGDTFNNNAGAGAFNFTGGGRALVFTENIANDMRGSLTGRNLYNETYGDALGTIITGSTDNWFISAFQPTLTVSGTDTSVTYNGNAHTQSGFTITGLVNGDTQAQALTTDPTLNGFTNAGTYTTGLIAGGASEIGYAIVLDQGNLTIDKATLTITGAGNITKTYDGTTTASVENGNFTIGGLIGSQTASITQTVGVYNDKDVADANVVTVALGDGDFSGTNGFLATNYSFPTNVLIGDGGTGTASITQAALTVTGAGNVTKTYDGTTTASVENGNFTVGGLTGAETLSITETAGVYNIKDVAAANVVTVTLGNGDFSGANGFDAGNYVLPVGDVLIGDGGTGTASITQAALTITADDVSQNENGTSFAGGGGVTANGFVGAEGLADLGGTLVYGGTSQGATASGTYTITPGGLTSTNYTIGFVDGTLSINAVVVPTDPVTPDDDPIVEDPVVPTDPVTPDDDPIVEDPVVPTDPVTPDDDPIVPDDPIVEDTALIVAVAEEQLTSQTAIRASILENEQRQATPRIRDVCMSSDLLSCSKIITNALVNWLGR